MPVDFLHTFPLTHEHALSILLDAPWSPAEKTWILQRSVSSLYHPIGNVLRKSWHLDDHTYPLPRHYMRRFALGDDGDISSLIILNWLALLRGESFNLAGYIQAFREPWLQKGLDPVTKQRLPGKI